MINEEYILLTQYIDEINMQNIGPTKFCQEAENSHKSDWNKSFKKFQTTCTSITHGKIILLCLHMSNVVRLGVNLSVKNF